MVPSREAAQHECGRTREQKRPGDEAEQSELITTLQEAIQEALTPHQRRVLVALAVNGIPIDVLAERLNTNRNALYKPLHDARRKLRRRQGDEAVGAGVDDRSIGSVTGTDHTEGPL